MILATNTVFLIAAIWSGAFRAWNRYYDSVLLVSLCNLLYNLLCHDYLTWTFHPDIQLGHVSVDILNTLMQLPSTVILFLHFFPSRVWISWLYVFLWVVFYSLLEYLWYLHGSITYAHGWTIGWSVLFYVVMFITIRLHHRHRLLGLAVCFIATIYLILQFRVPLR